MSRTAMDRAASYYVRRWELILRLAPKGPRGRPRCAYRGLRGKGRCRGALELDHIHGRTWNPAKEARWTRIVRYEQEAASGLLQVLCRRHNAAKH